MTEQLSGNYITREVHASLYLTVLEPRPFKGPNGQSSGEPRYSATIILEPNSPDLTAMKTLAAQVAKAEWPSLALSSLHFPFEAADRIIERKKAKLAKAGKTYDGKMDWIAGKAAFKAGSKLPVRLSCLDAQGKPMNLDGASLAAAKSKFYPGVKVGLEVNFQTYDLSETNRGVTAYLNMVFTTGEGERRGGGKDAAEVFGHYAGRSSTENPTGVPPQGHPVNDEIPM